MPHWATTFAHRLAMINSSTAPLQSHLLFLPHKILSGECPPTSNPEITVVHEGSMGIIGGWVAMMDAMNVLHGGISSPIFLYYCCPLRTLLYSSREYKYMRNLQSDCLDSPKKTRLATKFKVKYRMARRKFEFIICQALPALQNWLVQQGHLFFFFPHAVH